jgi:hypothetical protein
VFSGIARVGAPERLRSLLLWDGATRTEMAGPRRFGVGERPEGRTLASYRACATSAA